LVDTVKTKIGCL